MHNLRYSNKLSEIPLTDDFKDQILSYSTLKEISVATKAFCDEYVLTLGKNTSSILFDVITYGGSILLIVSLFAACYYFYNNSSEISPNSKSNETVISVLEKLNKNHRALLHERQRSNFYNGQALRKTIDDFLANKENNKYNGDFLNSLSKFNDRLKSLHGATLITYLYKIIFEDPDSDSSEKKK